MLETAEEVEGNYEIILCSPYKIFNRSQIDDCSQEGYDEHTRSVGRSLEGCESNVLEESPHSKEHDAGQHPGRGPVGDHSGLLPVTCRIGPQKQTAKAAFPLGEAAGSEGEKVV